MTRAFNMDCMEAMKQFPDKYFDLAVVDPPYGINITARHRERERERERRNWLAVQPVRSAVCGGFGAGRPPIKNGGATSKGSRNKQKLKVPSKFYVVFDDGSPPNAEYFRELQRVSKNVIIWGGNYFLDYLGKTKCMIVWDKKRREMDQADCEIAWTNINCACRVLNLGGTECSKRT